MPCPFCQKAVPVGSRRCPGCNALLVRAEAVDSTILSAGDADAQYSTDSPDVVRSKDDSTSGIAGMSWLGGGRGLGKAANDAVTHPDIPVGRSVGISSSISTRTHRGPDKTVWLMIGGALLAVVLLTSLVLVIVLMQSKEPATPPHASLLLGWPAKERYMGTVTIDDRRVALPERGPEEIEYRLTPGEHHLVLTRLGFETIDAVLTLKERDKFSYRPDWVLAKATSANVTEPPKPVEQPKPAEQPKPKPTEPPKASEPAKPAEPPPKAADKPKPTEPAKPKADEKAKPKTAEPAKPKPKDAPKADEKAKPKTDEKAKMDEGPKPKDKPKDPDKYKDSGIL